MVLVTKPTDAELVIPAQPYGSPHHCSFVCLKNEAWVAEQTCSKACGGNISTTPAKCFPAQCLQSELQLSVGCLSCLVLQDFLSTNLF